MEFKEAKLEWTMVILAGALLMGVLWVFKLIQTPSQIETVDVVYEMPRPMKSEISSEFSLGDREIIRELIQKKKKEEKAEVKNKPVAPAPKKTAQKKKEEKKKPELGISVVEADTKRMSEEEETERLEPAAAVNSPPVTEDKPEPEKKVKTLAEWRALLMAQPTKENMNSFIKAWRDREIEASGFYQVVQEMISTKKKDHQATALYGLQGVPHVMTFAMVAKQLDNLTPENHGAGSQILMSYSQPQRLGILEQALRMNDPVVVTRAAEAINVGLDRAKAGQSSSDPRQARGNEPSNQPPSQQNVALFGRFVPTFEQWRQSGNATLVNLANSFLTRWQT